MYTPYPNYYQPNYTQPNYGQLNYANSIAQQNQPQQGNSITWVLGENAAKSFPVGAEQSTQSSREWRIIDVFGSRIKKGYRRT